MRVGYLDDASNSNWKTNSCIDLISSCLVTRQKVSGSLSTEYS